MTRYEKDMLKFKKYGAARNEDGKYLVYILYEGIAGGLAYFLDGEYKRKRLFTKTFYKLLEEGKAVRVDPDEFKNNIFKDKGVMNKRTLATLQKEYEMDMQKILYGDVLLDQNGKYQTYILYENDPGGAMAYFFEDTGRRIRIHTSTFYRWLDEGKSVRVPPPTIWKK